MDFSAFNDVEPVKRGKYASENAALLKDGDYLMKVVGGGTKEVNGGPVVTITMKVTDAGEFFDLPVEKVYFFLTTNKATGEREKDARKIGELFNDLATMGINREGADLNWFLPRALKAMAGVEVVVKKKTNNGYANLYLNKRGDTDGKPHPFTKEDLDAAVATPFDGAEQKTPDEPLPF